MGDSVFQYNASEPCVTDTMKKAFSRNGYILLRNVLTVPELEKIKLALENDDGIPSRAYSRDDGLGKRSHVALWNHPGSDVTGILARMQRVAGIMQELMGGDEIYHYHSKLMMKNAHTGGRHVWHQDYGYWYNNGCLYPNMGSVFIPVDDCKRENSCLQVLKGSHLLGRINHDRIGEQLGADPERVEKAKLQLEHVYVEMKAGDILYFHCNLLHTSDQNASDLRRWVFIVAFNKRSNDPYKEHHHPRYTPMTKVPDAALLECNAEANLDDKGFMKLSDDISIKNKLH